jgi:hypothetical protein
MMRHGMNIPHSTIGHHVGTGQAWQQNFNEWAQLGSV